MTQGTHRVEHGLTFAAPDTQHIAAVCECGRWGAYITGYPLPMTWHLYYSHLVEDGCSCDIHRRTVFIGFHPSNVVMFK